MLNEQSDEYLIKAFIKKYTEHKPLSYWLMSKIKYKADKKQINDLNVIYDSVKHILIKDRESIKTKKRFY